MHIQEIAILTSLPVLESSMFVDFSLNKRADSWDQQSISAHQQRKSSTGAVTTTHLGKIRSNQAGGLFIWFGMYNRTRYLIQSIIGSHTAVASGAVT